MAIAMKDLEIRGAGNLLGGEQSGHIADVGFDLYVRLVGEAVDGVPRRRPRRRARRGHDRAADRRAPAARLHPQRAAAAGDVQAAGRGPHRRGRRPDPRGDGRPVRRAAGRGRLAAAGGAVPGPGPAGRAHRGHDRRASTSASRPSTLPDSRVVRLNRLYPKSIVKAPVSTILVPRPQTAVVGGTPIAGVALLEWARQVIDTVIDPRQRNLQEKS